jgi:CspA family cold shock protein
MGDFVMELGVVKWFNDNKGFGFIQQDPKDPDIFVHYSAIDQQGYKSLKEGDRVEFELSDKPTKGPSASYVRKIK